MCSYAEAPKQLLVLTWRHATRAILGHALHADLAVEPKPKWLLPLGLAYINYSRASLTPLNR